MKIDAKLVAELRKRTGLPMMKCKAALVESEGDIEKAEDLLRKQGHKTAEKMAGRALKDGLVFTHQDDAGMAALAFFCETDFVARNEDFQALGQSLVDHIYAHGPADQGDGEATGQIRMPDDRPAQAHMEDLIGKIRENMALGSYARFKSDGSRIFSYVHHDQKVAALVDLAGAGSENPDIEQLGRELCMHIVFHKPKALDADAVDPEWVQKEREIFEAQAAEHPEERRAKIAEGKLMKRLKEVVMLEQPYIKDEKVSVRDKVAAVAKETGADLSVRRFALISTKS